MKILKLRRNVIEHFHPAKQYLEIERTLPIVRNGNAMQCIPGSLFILENLDKFTVNGEKIESPEDFYRKLNQGD